MNNRAIAAEYKPIRLLGRGAFAEVYLARHLPTSQLYVLKRLPFKPATTEEQKNERQAAEREVELLCQLRHPNITQYKESFLDMDGNRINIVLEFCEKGTLAGVIGRQKDLSGAKKYLPEEKVWGWAAQLLFAVSYLHRLGIVHRDIKPGNIFTTKTDQLKLGDFGIAKVVSGTVSMTTHSGMVGSPFYLSPEICEQQSYTAKGDIWALGVSLYELCTLHVPFPGTNILAVLNAILTRTPAPMPAQYSAKLNEFIFAMLEKSPEKRPSISELIQHFLRPELIHRMERALTQHLELAPQGIPLKGGMMLAQAQGGRARRTRSLPPAA
eukprot:RCo044859